MVILDYSERLTVEKNTAVWHFHTSLSYCERTSIPDLSAKEQITTKHAEITKKTNWKLNELKNRKL